MKAYQFVVVQKIPLSLSETWDFFSSPLNLAKITPAEMAFTIVSDSGMISKMYPGMLISYKVSVAGIKLDWMTEITHVVDEKYFVDEQRFGPYKFWHHQHHFTEIEGGVEIKDIVTYGLSFGPLGALANKVYVGPKLQQIFEFRREKVTALFGHL